MSVKNLKTELAWFFSKHDARLFFERSSTMHDLSEPFRRVEKQSKPIALYCSMSSVDHQPPEVGAPTMAPILSSLVGPEVAKWVASCLVVVLRMVMVQQSSSELQPMRSNYLWFSQEDNAHTLMQCVLSVM